jgi:cytidine deaminase
MYIGALRAGPRPYTGGYDELIERARLARDNAYAPYSEFRVGAALLSKSGRIYSAGNVENASTGAGICAERITVAMAVAAGEHDFEAIAVVGDTARPIAPCGICRQSLIEFGGDIKVIMANLLGDAVVATASELLPMAFTAECLERK